MNRSFPAPWRVWLPAAVAGLLLSCLGLAQLWAEASQRSDPGFVLPAVSPLAGLPLCFEAANGPDVESPRFMARGSEYQFIVSPLQAQLTWRSGATPPLGKAMRTVRGAGSETGETRRIRMVFLHANPNASMRGDDELSGKINYLIGRDPSQWKLGINTYRQVCIEGLYPGVDLAYHGNQRQLEYDFRVASGSDPGPIALRFEGVDRLTTNTQGELVLAIGGDVVCEHRPVCYELDQGVRRSVSGRYRLESDGTVGFNVDGRDPRLPLVIDPILAQSTFFGGRGGDVALSVKVDSTGAVYVAGLTLSQIPFTNQSTPPGFTQSFQGGTTSGDGFVAKFDQTLTNLVFLTYLGGSQDDGIYDMALDSANNVYLTGFTDSTNFPVVPPGGLPGFPWTGRISGAANTNAPHPYPVDAFVTELAASGTNLIYSIYFGAEDTDVGDGIAVDSLGNAYITGYTFSTNFPTLFAFQSALGGTNHTANAFVAKINAGGSGVAYSSYLGGTNLDEGQGIAVDSQGMAYVTGFTSSTNFPTTENALQRTLNGFTNLPLANDAFIAQFDMTQSGADSLLYSTFLGGTNAEAGNRICVDAQTNVYLTGYTYSQNFPNTQTNLLYTGLMTNGVSAPPNSDAFLTKLSFAASPPQLVWSTVFGGTNNDMGWDVALDPAGQAAYVAGITVSTNFPVFDYFGYLSPTNFGSNDVFVTVFTNDGSAVLYSAYMGGNRSDYGFGVAVDDKGSAYVVGRTLSTNFPVVGGLQSSLLSSNNAFLAKIELTNRLLSVTIATSPSNLLFTLEGTNYVAPVTFTNWSPGVPLTLTAPPVQPGDGGLEYVWAAWSDRGFFSHTLAPLGDTTVRATFLSQTASNHVAIVTNGSGSLSPNYIGQTLQPGTRYSTTAKPSSGYVFSSWTGDFPTNSPTVSFVMNPGVYLQANFIPNPFIPIQGKYAGLFYDTNGVTFSSSGFFSSTLSSLGALSGNLILAGKSYSFSGQVANNGSFAKSISRGQLTPVSLTLQVDLTGGNAITGQISDGTFTAELLANLAVYSSRNFAPQIGKYTLVIPGADDSSAQPGGAGFGSVNVDLFGNVAFSGTLGDGTAMSQGTFISGRGTWPFYATLYSGGGSILGWLTFAAQPYSDLGGTLFWHKNSQASSKLYPAGFTVQADAAGSYYSPYYFGTSNSAPILGFTNGLAIFQGGNLSAPFTNRFTLGPNNKVTNLESNKLSMSFQSSSGLFQGSVVDPVSRKSLSFNGAVLQKQNNGSGLFRGTNQTGSIRLESR